MQFSATPAAAKPLHHYPAPEAVSVPAVSLLHPEFKVSPGYGRYPSGCEDSARRDRPVADSWQAMERRR